MLQRVIVSIVLKWLWAFEIICRRTLLNLNYCLRGLISKSKSGHAGALSTSWGVSRSFQLAPKGDDQRLKTDSQALSLSEGWSHPSSTSGVDGQKE